MSKQTDLMNINSDKYWDKRFSENWDEKGGPQQSRFFAHLALDMLPKWIIREIRRGKLTVVDWGCAEGDGTDVLSECINKSQLFGRDFSKVAIDIAVDRYSGISFKTEDWLNDENEYEDSVFDVVFSSNTLEHFHAPYEVLEKLSRRARKALILLLPYREYTRLDEHFSSFTPGNILASVDTRFSLISSKVLDCSKLLDSQWLGEQVLLVYADNAWVSSLSLVLEDLHIEADNFNQKLKTIELTLSENTVKVQNLASELSEETAKVQKLTNELSSEVARVKELQSELEVCSKELVYKNEMLEGFDSLKSEFHYLEERYNELLHSNSWKLTSPLRFSRRAYQNRKRTFYSALKWFYWRLPVSIRQALQGPRHAIVRRLRGTSNAHSAPINVSNSNDLSWSEFKDRVLVNRSSYKGIFIQEFSIDWNVPLYQRPQHISAAMARLGYLVIYRTGNWAGDDVNGFREVEKNVWVSNRSEVDEISGALRSIYSTAFYLTVDYVKNISKDSVLVYEYIDHIDPEISGDEKNIKLLLELNKFAFDGGVDYVVASANQLYDEAIEALGEERVLLAQNGVDTRHYRNPEHKQVSLPSELEEFCNRYENVVGYFGALAPWLWYDEIAELIEKRKDLGFVFIGPDYYGGSAKLAKGSNVLQLGPVDYKVLPAYAKRFDICFIPFKPGDIAQTTSPLKLFEYFALEKPVVVTSYMRECVQYPEVFRGGDAEELSKALDEAIAVKDDPVFKQRMAKLADENDWDQRAKVISRCFKDI